MSHAALENALKKQLYDAALGYPIAWPNQTLAESAKPYLAVQHFRGAANRRGPKGTDGHDHLGIFQVTVVVDQNSSTGTAHGIADAIAAAFPPASRLTFTGGYIDLQSVETGPGIPDDGSWRVPVSIEYRAVF